MTNRSLLDRALRPFSKVHPGEGLQAFLLMTCVFLILASYYLMKTAREGLILTDGTFGLRGEVLKSYAGGAMAVLLVGIVPAYGVLANRVRRIQLINISYAIAIGCLLVFYALARMEVPIGLVFFIWIGILNMFLVAQFWSYANDLYTEEQGKRLFAIIAVGGSLGALAGPELSRVVSTFTLLPLAGALLVGCLALFNAIERIAAKRAASVDVAKPLDGAGGFSLVIRTRYLLLIAALVLVSELVKTNGEFVLSSAATEHAARLVPSSAHAELAGAARIAAITDERRAVIQAFYSQFYFWANMVSLVIQAFVVSRLVAWLGVRRALFVMPIVALGAYGVIAAVGGIAVIRAAKIGENSTEYSVENTVRQLLFLPTARDVKYKAKAAIDTFVVRGADTLSALFVFGATAIGLRGHGLAVINIGLIAVWIVVAIGVVRNYRPPSAAKT